MHSAKASGLAVLAVCAWGLTVDFARSAQDIIYHATEWSGGAAINLGNLPGSTYSIATGINNVGQVVGYSEIGTTEVAMEWSGGQAFALPGPPGSEYSYANGINSAGQVVGESPVGGVRYATEWSGGQAFALPRLPGSVASYATGINNAGQVVGESSDWRRILRHGVERRQRHQSGWPDGERV